MKTKTEESKQNTKNSVGRACFVAISILIQVLWIVNSVIRLADYYAMIATISSLLAVALTLRIYAKHTNSAYKISWIILVLVFPIFGICLYLLFGNEGTTAAIKKNFDKVRGMLNGLLVQKEETAKALEEEDKGIFNQTYYLQKQCGYPVYQDTDIEFYSDTKKALEAQKEELKKAEKFIFMEYHAIEDSTAWAGIEKILVEKAAAGVEVRVFYDDMGSIGFLSKPFEKRLNSEGIKCHVFNPLIPIVNVFMNNRDHRKITVIDGKVGFTGGYNLADEYFNLTHPYGEWKDSGVKLVGAAVRSLTVIFLEMWNAVQKTPEDVNIFLPDFPYQARENGYVQPYADSPLYDENIGENVYLNMIKNAKDYVYITTPYLIIDDEMQKELILAAGRGVDVRIITPGIPDKKIIFGVTRSYYAVLAIKGVRIFEYTPGFIHSKQFVCDDEIAAVGTINMDFRSLYLHFENGCLFSHCKAVKEVRKDFEELFPVCEEVTKQYAKKKNLALKGKERILRLFSPLM